MSFLRYHEISKQEDCALEFIYYSENWQAAQQHCCWAACQISKQSDHYNIKFCHSMTSLDLMVRCIPLSDRGTIFLSLTNTPGSIDSPIRLMASRTIMFFIEGHIHNTCHMARVGFNQNKPAKQCCSFPSLGLLYNISLVCHARGSSRAIDLHRSWQRTCH